MSYHLRNYIILCILIVTAPCIGMENKPNILSTLIKGGCPEIEFVTNNHIILNNYNYDYLSQKGCYLINLKKNVVIKEITIDQSIFPKDKECTLTLALHPNRKTFCLMQGYDHSPEVLKDTAFYDTTTGDPILIAADMPSSNSIISYPIFNPSDDTIFYWENGDKNPKQWNYATQTPCENITIAVDENRTFIDCHPTRQELCIGYPSNNNITICDTKGLFIKQIIRPFEKITKDRYGEQDLHRPVKYNIDGSLIASFNLRSIDLIETEYYAFKHKYTCDEAHTIKAASFHPNNMFLAVLLKPDNIIEYFNIKEQKVVAQTKEHAPSKDDWRDIATLKFDPHGKKLLTIINYTQKIVAVPFKVIYDTQLLPFILFILKNYKLNKDSALPYDIIKLLTKATLKSFKY